MFFLMLYVKLPRDKCIILQFLLYSEQTSLGLILLGISPPLAPRQCERLHLLPLK